MFGITNFRWFSDDRTERIREARRASDIAHGELQDYSDHYHETHPRDYTETPEYLRLNEIAWNAHQDLRRERGLSYRRIVPRDGGELAGDPPAARRRVTVEEAAVLQGFRPDYPWRGSKTSRYQQCGNAIPVQMASAVLRAVLT